MKVILKILNSKKKAMYVYSRLINMRIIGLVFRFDNKFYTKPKMENSINEFH